MNRDNFFYETKGMAYFVLEGHSLVETAKEFGISKKMVKKRLKSIGYTYADLAEIRKARKNKQSS